MALIPCPECNRQISDKAANCPHCGNPLTGPADKPQRAALSVETAPGRVVRTEATAKIWKVVQFAGFATCVVGVVMYVGGDRIAGIYTMFLGFVIFIAGRFLGWWKHG